jgi:hypothetical protein
MTTENGEMVQGGGPSGSQAPDGGHEPLPAQMPRPTYWPAVLALSICFALWGVLTSVWMIVVGGAGAVLAAARWFGELRDEPVE